MSATNAMFNRHPRPWKVVKRGNSVILAMNKNDIDPYISTAEDDCIADANGVEVIGCSEWFRGKENLRAIVAIVNNHKEFS